MKTFKFQTEKARLRDQLIEQGYQLLAAQELNEDLWARIRSTEERVTEWRHKYEDLRLTPEIKADTEAAFNRGVYYAKTKMSAWFLEQARTMQYGVTDTTDGEKNVD